MTYKLACPQREVYTSGVFKAYAEGRPCPNCNESLTDSDGRTARSYYSQLEPPLGPPPRCAWCNRLLTDCVSNPCSLALKRQGLDYWNSQTRAGHQLNIRARIGAPLEAFNSFILAWVDPQWHAHLLDNDENDGQRVRDAISAQSNDELSANDREILRELATVTSERDAALLRADRAEGAFHDLQEANADTQAGQDSWMGKATS